MYRLLTGVLCVVMFFMLGCSRQPSDEEVVAVINDYQMTGEDFKDGAEIVAVYRPLESGSLDEKMQVLDTLIDKEILLQEAQSQNLHKDEKFLKTIENYWKQTLLRVLIENKMREISGKTRVYDDEIRDYYEKLSVAEPDTPPISEIRQEIERIIRQKKETEAMQRWQQKLKSQADITINEEVLADIQLK